MLIQQSIIGPFVLLPGMFIEFEILKPKNLCLLYNRLPSPQGFGQQARQRHKGRPGQHQVHGFVRQVWSLSFFRRCILRWGGGGVDAIFFIKSDRVAFTKLEILSPTIHLLSPLFYFPSNSSLLFEVVFSVPECWIGLRPCLPAVCPLFCSAMHPGLGRILTLMFHFGVSEPDHRFQQFLWLWFCKVFISFVLIFFWAFTVDGGLSFVLQYIWFYIHAYFPVNYISIKSAVLLAGMALLHVAWHGTDTIMSNMIVKSVSGLMLVLQFVNYSSFKKK